MKDLNNVIFRYKYGNKNKTTFASKDERNFAVYFTEFAIRKLEELAEAKIRIN